MATVKWLTYSRFRSSDQAVYCTREATAKCPTGFSDPRPATKAEINAELQKRAEKDRKHQTQAAFESRPDYKDANVIRNLLEFMTPDNHPLDRLTPQEWKSLREKLES